MSKMYQRSILTETEALKVFGGFKVGQTQIEEAIGVEESVIKRTWNSFIDCKCKAKTRGRS